MKTQKFVVALLCALALLAVADTVAASDAAGPWTKVAGIYSKSNGGNPFVDFESGGHAGLSQQQWRLPGYVQRQQRSGLFRPACGVDSGPRGQGLLQLHRRGFRWSMCIIEAVYIR